ncbi:hypothetical protein C8F01DRAFT_1122312 [Mycena amicta]|nr:hypothetical protein C8F01DRAFT_1122312 [Mycena amicta]
MLFTALFLLVAVYSTLLLAWHVLRRRLLATVIGVPDLPLLKKAREGDKIDGTAVICGGSVAGLLTARICHGHFRKVLIIEPDAWVATEEARTVSGWNQGHPRTRILQWNSLHGSQPYLFSGMSHLFPKLETECEQAHIQIAPHNPRFNISGLFWKIPHSSFKPHLPKSMYTTRPALEKLLRRLVLDKDLYPSIELMTGTVTEVIPDPADASRICKVVVRNDQGAIRDISAALVADCTGPARAGMKWLARRGYGGTSDGKNIDQLKISIDQKLRYCTMTFKMDQKFHSRLPFPDEFKHIKPVFTFLEDLNEETTRKGRAVFIITRKDEWTLVVFTGHYGTTRPRPRTVEELKQYILDLHTVVPIPEWVLQLVHMLHEIEDTAIVSRVKVPPTTYVRYHLAAHLPSNFVALGDSVMTVNPLFGEGWTKALRCVMALQKVLLRTRTTIPGSFSREFFEEEHAKTDWMWENSRVQDYGFPTTVPVEGESLSSGAFIRWYVTWLQRLAVTDEHAGLAMYEAVCGFGSPVDALHPHLVAKVFWTALTSAKKW